MQTFMPYADLDASIRCLDPNRLGNQVYMECNTLVGGGWSEHPASLMWRGYESALCQYALFGVEELARRGYDYPRWRTFFTEKMQEFGEPVLPPWIGDDRVHSSHRSALLFKNAEWYGQFGWSEPPAGPDESGRWRYFWPVTKETV